MKVNKFIIEKPKQVILPIVMTNQYIQQVKQFMNYT